MFKPVLTLLTISSLTACAQHGRLVDPEVSNICGGNGYVQITLHYGDSLLRVTPPVIKVTQNEEIRFRLNPDKEYTDPENIDYNKVLVVVTGGEGSWINTKGEHGGKRKPYLSLCVPEGLEKIPYKYEVDIDSVGTLDPRIRVF